MSNMAPTKHASTYVKFLHLANAMRQMPTLPVLDEVEERLLGMCMAALEQGKKIAVTEAARLEPNTPERTAFRRIKSLHSKGLVTFEASDEDQRIKYILPTKAAEQYFDTLGKCVEQAREGQWPPTELKPT